MTIKPGDDCVFFSPIRDWDDFICTVESIRGCTAVVRDLLNKEQYEVPVNALAPYPFVGIPFGQIVETGDTIDGIPLEEGGLLVKPWGEPAEGS